MACASSCSLIPCPCRIKWAHLCPVLGQWEVGWCGLCWQWMSRRYGVADLVLFTLTLLLTPPWLSVDMSCTDPLPYCAPSCDFSKSGNAGLWVLFKEMKQPSTVMCLGRRDSSKPMVVLDCVHFTSSLPMASRSVIFCKYWSGNENRANWRWSGGSGSGQHVMCTMKHK